MTVAPEAVQASTPACWCCGAEFEERDLVRLGSHPEVGVCFGCARFLQRAPPSDKTSVAGLREAV
jgi:hypothetical protein